MSSIFFSPKNESLIVFVPKKLKLPCKEIRFENHYYSPPNKEVEVFLKNRVRDAKKHNKPLPFEEIKKRTPENSDKLKILVVRKGGLGDILFTTPVIQYLSEMGHIVDVLPHYGYWQAFNHNPFVRNIFVNQPLTIHTHPELIDREGYGPFCPVIPEVFNPADILNYDKVYSFRGVIEDNLESESLHAVDVSYKWLGIDPEGKPKKPLLYVTEEEKEIVREKLYKYRGVDPDRKIVCVSPRATAINRSWPYYEEFMDDYSEEFNIIKLHWDEGWEKGKKPWNIRESMAIAAVSDVVISTDSGMLHVAGALGVPTIALFGPFNPELRVKYYDKCDVICHTKEVCPSGNFCFNHNDECLALGRSFANSICMRIEPVEVYNKVMEVFAREDTLNYSYV